MNTLTTEQIKQILEGAPEGEEHVNFPICGGLTHEVHRLDDLREILTLRQRVEDLEAQQSQNMDDFLNALEQGILIGSTEDRIRHLLSEVAARAVSRPMQPITKDDYGRDRFEENPIVSFLATEVLDLNKIAVWCIENNIDKEHQEQLAQLIGYSVDGYGTLSYVSDESYERANQLRKGEGDE